MNSMNKYVEELFTHNNQLVKKTEWESRIKTLKEKEIQQIEISSQHKINDLETQKTIWKNTFTKAILNRADYAVKQNKKIGVLFSGGVDSTLIALVLQKNNIPFTCFTVGFQDTKTKTPEDIIEAEKIAALYGWNMIKHNTTMEEATIIVETTINILGDVANPITVGIGAVVVCGAELAIKNDITVLFTGLGSEEIFAGYRRHERALNGVALRGLNNNSNKTNTNNTNTIDSIEVSPDAMHEECWRGLSRMYDRDLIRDTRLCSALGITALTPFLDPDVIITTMNMPANEKIKEGHKKYILRVMAEEMGLAHEYAFRPKLAAQYGSKFDSAIEKLRKSGIGSAILLDNTRE